MESLNQLPCPVLVTDEFGYIVSVNEEMLSLLGTSREHLLRKPMDDILPSSSRIFLQTHIWPMLLSQDNVRELYLHLSNAQKQRIPVLVNARKNLFADAVCYYWVFFVAQERSRFEAELLQARSEAQRMSASLSQAIAELESMHVQLSERAHDIEIANRELAELSQSDPLTGLGNRRALANAVKYWQSQNTPSSQASLLLVDVDHFKAVNDNYGHDEGDRVLVSLSHQLQSSLKTSDLAVRYGGEEFALWLPSSGREDAECTAQRIHENVQRVTVADNSITVSIGVATCTNALDTEFLNQLIKRSDQAVYLAKAAGRNQTLYFE